MASTNLNFRIDSELKQDMESLFEELGLTMSAAITMFFKYCRRYGGYPLDLRLDQPNAETAAALAEADRLVADKGTKRYSLDEALRELKE